MATNGSHAPSPSDRARELRTELASKIASFMGSEENRATDIHGLTLHRRIAPTAPCSMTYEPAVTVICAQPQCCPALKSTAWETSRQSDLL